jgi:hypothetical protein
MKIYPVFLDGPLEGKEHEWEYTGSPTMRVYDAYTFYRTGEPVEYQLKQIGFHLNGLPAVLWIASIGEPDTRDFMRHAFSDYAKKALVTPNQLETKCICAKFSDTGGARIADLTCPIHGVNGTDPGDDMRDKDG